MLTLTKAILGTTKGIITVLSGQLITHISGSIDGLFSLMMPIHAGQMFRFEQVKKKVDQEVKSFEEELKRTILGPRVRIHHEVGFLTNKIEKHVQSAERKLKRYIRKTDELESYLGCKAKLIDSISAYLLETLSISNKISRLKYPKGRIDKAYIAKYDVPFVRGYIEEWEDFRNHLEMFLYHREYTLYLIEEKIKKLIDFLKDVLLSDPTNDIIIGNRSFEFQKGSGRRYDQDLTSIRDSILKLVDLEEKLRVLRRKAGSLNPFVDFFKQIGELKKSMLPVKKYIKTDLLLFVEGLEHTRTTKDDLLNFVKGMESGIQKTIRKLHNAQKIIKFLQIVELKLRALRAVPEPKLENIGGHISKLNDWIVTAKRTPKTVHLGFRENIGQTVQIDRHDEIRSGPVQIKEYINRVVPELIKHVNSEISTLKSIKSIHKQLKAIEDIVIEQDKAMNEGMTNGGLGSSSLEKIKKAIGGLVAIKSNIDKIEECFKGKKDELSHIKANIDKLNSLKLDLWKLEFSIHSDIMFAKIIENIRGNFESLKTEAQKEFEKVKSLIDKLITNIELIIRTLGSIHCIIKPICCKEQELSELRKLKPTIDDLRLYLERLSQCINVTNGYLGVLNYRISVLQKYVEMLCNLESRIKRLESESSYFPILESLPELLFVHSGLDFMIKCHTFFKEIQESIKCALNTIENCRFVLGITIFGTNSTKNAVSCLVERIKKRKEEIIINILTVESSIENVIICFLKCSNKSITKNRKESTKKLLTSGGQVYNCELANPLLRCSENIG